MLALLNSIDLFQLKPGNNTVRVNQSKLHLHEREYSTPQVPLQRIISMGRNHWKLWGGRDTRMHLLHRRKYFWQLTKQPQHKLYWLQNDTPALQMGAGRRTYLTDILWNSLVSFIFWSFSLHKVDLVFHIFKVFLVFFLLRTEKSRYQMYQTYQMQLHYKLAIH